MAIKWTNKSAINREIEMAERHTDHSEDIEITKLILLMKIYEPRKFHSNPAVNGKRE